MRLLLFSLLVFITSALSAQCINIDVISIDCDGPDLFTAIVVVSGEGDSWFYSDAQTTISGAYGDTILVGPFTEDVFINFADLDDADCTASAFLSAPECGPEPCSGFFLQTTSDEPCENSGATRAVTVSGGTFPVTIEITDPTGVTSVQIADSPNGIIITTTISGVYTLVATDAAGCSNSLDFLVGGACGSISGFSWFDDDGDGITDAGESGVEAVTVQLFNSLGSVIRTTSTDGNGGFTFQEVSPGGFFLRFLVPEGLQPTLFQQGGGSDDSDVENPDGSTPVFTLQAGEDLSSVNAGWIDADCFVTATSTDLLCGGDASGTIFLTASGTPPFTFEWSNGSTVGPVLSGLAAGSYFVTVTDADNCVATTSANVFAPPALTVQVTQVGVACTPDLGPLSLEAFVSGGTAPYTYAWENGINVSVLQDVQPNQNYLLVVTDANGCTVTVVTNIPPNTQTINWFSPFHLGCDGESVLISTEDESGTYEYTWLTPSFDTIVGFFIEATEVGEYTLVGIDPNGGCQVTGIAVVIDGGLPSTIAITTRQDSSCVGSQCVTLTGLGDSQNNGTAYWTFPDGSTASGSLSNFYCNYGPGLYAVQVRNECDTINHTIILEEQLGCSLLSGRLYLDAAGNCSLDAEDIPAPGIMLLIEAESSGLLYYEITNSAGYFGVELPIGDYTITPIVDDALPFGVCDPAASVTVILDVETVVDVFLPATVACPLMTTTVGMPFLRRCFNNEAWVNYENKGSVVAEDATLTITLDPFFTNVTPSITPVSQDGNTFVFALGDLAPFEGGQIGFIFTLSCDASLGQSHCIEASVTPDDACADTDGWNGALVKITEARCDGDQLIFTVENVGGFDMTVPLTYLVVEDGIMVTGVPVVLPAITAGQFVEIPIPSNGSTVHVITNQEPNAPASPEPTAMVEGCPPGLAGGFSTGFANILPLGNGVPSEAITCRQNIGSFDPNDKYGYPLGWDGGNIEQGTKLTYAIRFQNTGTDTAFNVVITDTIGLELDLSTFVAGTASHDYTVNIDSNRVITFAFANIMLPDSNINLVASNGVVNFTIDHAPELTAGDVILNEAAIYFDFNEPVITNVSRHVIATDGLPVATRQQLAQQLSVKVYPNPNPGVLNIDIPREDLNRGDVLNVMDAFGRILVTKPATEMDNAWNVSQLPNGYYVLLVTDAAGRAKGRSGFVIAR